MINPTNLALVGIWILIQGALVWYQSIALHETRRALRRARARGDVAVEIGVERLRSNLWRMSVIILYLVIGVLALLPIRLGPAAVIVLVYGEAVLLRNTRADVRLVRRLAHARILDARAEEPVES